MSLPIEPTERHPSLHSEILPQFLRWAPIATVGFASFVFLVAFYYQDTDLLLTAIVLLLFQGALVLAARRQRSQQTHSAILIICVVLFVAILAVASAQPRWITALFIAPLLGVAVALPYIHEAQARWVMVSSWIVSVAILVWGELAGPASGPTRPMVEALRISGAAIVMAVVLLLFWLAYRQLWEALAFTRAAEERYSLAVQGATDGLWDWDLREDTIYFSPRWKEMIGLAPQLPFTKPAQWMARIHPDEQARVREEIQAHLSGQTTSFESEYRLRHENGKYRWMLARGLVVRNLRGEPVRIAGAQTDITERKKIEAQLLHDAYHDALTGLPNRAFFLERLSQAIRRDARLPDQRFAIFFMDLDRFKVLNDSMGHSAGDQLLVEVGRRLCLGVRPYDTVARLGGDEFTILLTDLEEYRVAIDVAERILESLLQPYHLDKGEAFVSASIGIVLSEVGHQTPEEYLRDADIALYSAKGQGRGRFALFDQAMHDEVVALQRLDTALRHAIEWDELRVCYQPIISLRSGRITGFEALMRWHPITGPVSPAEFIPVAEETGQIDELSWWILERSCRQLVAWHQRSSYSLTMNVNWPRRLLQNSLPLDRLATMLHDCKVNPHQLRLEITESALEEDTDMLIQNMKLLRALNVQLHLDDFGTGYSSLSTLHELPLHALKIDRSFVSRLGVEEEATEIIQAIVSLSHHLGLSVTAEGIETERQLAILRTMGCDYGQGYLFAPPLAAEEALRLLESGTEW